MSAKSEPIQYRKTDWIIYWDDSGKRRNPVLALTAAAGITEWRRIF